MTTDPIAPTVRCNKCGWTGTDGDLQFVERDAVDKEPSDACPTCLTDHHLMDAPWEHEI